MEKTNIQKLYDDEKSRKFVNHLIQSYLPINKVEKVWQFEDKKPVHKCACCKHELIDLNTVMTRMHTSKEFMEDSLKDLKSRVIDQTPVKREDTAIVKHITHGAIMAFTGEKTDTFLCQSCVQNLLEMVQTGIIMGDKNINYIMHKMQRGAMFNHFKESPVLNEEEKERVKEIEEKVEVNKKHKATFGDIEVLQQLKAKMEAESKSE